MEKQYVAESIARTFWIGIGKAKPELLSKEWIDLTEDERAYIALCMVEAISASGL